MEQINHKILVGGIQKFSTDDGPGIRTTVFLKGCPLRCKWCHNPELISPKQEIIRMPNSCIKCGYCRDHCPEQAIYLNEEQQVDIDRSKCSSCMTCVKNCFAEGLRAVGTLMSADEVMRDVIKDKTFYDNTGGGMTISGGELLSHSDFAMELIHLAAENGIQVCLDSSGCGDSARLLELALCDNVTDILYDMKCINPVLHEELTGMDNALILQNLVMLAETPATAKKLHMRMPLVEGLNDALDLMARTAEFYRTHGLRKLTLLPYHSLGVSKMKHIGGRQEVYKAPSDEHLERIRSLFAEIPGMDVEISGIARK